MCIVLLLIPLNEQPMDRRVSKIDDPGKCLNYMHILTPTKISSVVHVCLVYD